MDEEFQMATQIQTSNTQQQFSSNVIIASISFLLLLILIYPWIIAVTVIFFGVGFGCLEPLDKFIKTSIASGRFGPQIQSRYKHYINLDQAETEDKKTIKKEVTEDPLREYLEEEEHKASLQSQIQQQQQQQEAALTQAIQNTLTVPGRSSSSSNRSSPEKSKSLLDSPARSLSAASSRRVSEDIPSSLVTHQNRRESSKKTPSPSHSSSAATTPSPSKTLKAEVAALRVDQELRVDPRVDNSFGRLCTNIINYYISPSWAPYETRRQLKLSFKQLLTAVAEQFNKKFIIPCENEGSNEGYPPIVKLAQEKLVPLMLHYVDKTVARGVATVASPSKNVEEIDPIISPESKRRVILKIRKFCNKIFERFLNKDDQNCKLWMELCISVLADGVLVNVMNLGKDKLPELLEQVVDNFKKSTRAAVRRRSKPPSLTSTPKKVKNEDQFLDPLSCENYVGPSSTENQPRTESELLYENEGSAIGNSKVGKFPGKVPFLLDSFLDPPHNLEKPDQIVSRWRPTLKDIVSETDLLYPLIQYMKHVGGQQSLAFLQGVLDEYPLEGDPYCRRILELEFLPGFCRSSLLLETLGLDRVEVALDVGATDPFSSMRRSSTNGSSGGHTRSASYGGPSTSSFREFLKIEQGIVDGLPLTESSSQNLHHIGSVIEATEQIEVGVTGNGNTAMLPGAGVIEPNLAFKRRPHLEMYIAKFIKSTTKSWKQFYDPLAEQFEPAKRMGIDAKSYDEWSHPEVNSRVVIKASTGDIYDSFIDLVTSLMRNSPIASPFASGLANFLKPYLMPVFDSELEKNLSQILSTDLLITVVDLIADVFEESSEDSDGEVKTGNNDEQINSRSAAFIPETTMSEEEDSQHHHNSSCTTCDPSFKSTVKSFLEYLFECFMLNFIDLDHFVLCFKQNREYIFLFFVDLLDVLVSEIVEEE